MEFGGDGAGTGREVRCSDSGRLRDLWFWHRLGGGDGGQSAAAGDQEREKKETVHEARGGGARDY
jgi:hypothetical protein